MSPRSPRATIMPSVSKMISSRFSIPAWCRFSDFRVDEEEDSEGELMVKHPQVDTPKVDTASVDCELFSFLLSMKEAKIRQGLR